MRYDHRLRLGSFFLALVLLGAGLVSADAAKRAKDLELTILSSTSNRGEVDPCGWHKTQKGGLARRAALIDSLRKARGGLLLVDAGDYAHPTLTHEEQENWFILRAMDQMRYDAMTLGELEFYRGAKYVQAILDSTRIPVTVANARFTATRAPIGKPYILTKVGDVTYGIIGLIGQDFGEGKEKLIGLGFTVDDPFEVAAKVIPEVRKQADLVVVLAHLGSADAFQLPKSVKGIDVVVFGHYPGTVAPTQVEGAVTVRPGQRGQYMGETKIVLSPENKIVSYSGEAVALDVKKIGEEPRIARELAALKKALGKPETVTPPAEPEDPRNAFE